MDAGWLPFWTDLRCRAAFFRPLTALTHRLDFTLLGGSGVLMHAHSLAWFALLLGLVAALYRRVMGRTQPAWVAVLAALLFAVDDAHGIPAGWLANRNVLIAGVFGVLALLAYDRWRADGWRPGAALAPLALALALLAKEEAVAVGGYLLAYALFLDRGSWHRRLGALAPCVFVGAAWVIAYQALGFGVRHSHMYVDPLHDPLRYAGRVARNAPVLLLGQWAVPDADFANFLSRAAFRVYWLWAVGVLAGLAVLLVPVLRASRQARFWALGMALAVLPVAATFPSDRLLLFVGLGAMPLLAQLLHALAAPGAKSGAVRRARKVAAVGLVGIHLVLAPLLLPAKAVAFRFVDNWLTGCYESLPTDAAFAEQTAIFVNDLFPLGDMAWQLDRRERGQMVPRRTLHLNASLTGATFQRTDARTLVVRPEGGYLRPRGTAPGVENPPALSPAYLLRYFDLVGRDPDDPMPLGQTVRLPDVSVTISDLTADGRPAEATFRFREPLEHASYRWLMLDGGRYVRFTPPAVGETVHVPAPQP
jgi:hypothetical protein